ncbi:threonine synthase|uniref:Threonine synthase n=1 Tax=Dendrosporobacter quercicolus TaxID=146817 RepID=A0A1G9ZCA1_9FIRM|nr:threonine synthase [Dendrosporobacter quercicolus]NSL49775.1 threonine synthase [Dendrosporobacter quercicolus DSM 1736]SDN19022.1 threonine synthase [Dendrosporobacter quercicolus]
MKYSSTRGREQLLVSAEAIISGIADNGGLFVPLRIPVLDRAVIASLAGLSYQQRAVKILNEFLTDYCIDDLNRCIAEAYHADKFDDKAIAPLKTLPDGNYVLELWHGPTSAFKDMALQLLPQLMSRALQMTGESDEIVILVATSGDTGKAALEGFRDIEQIKIIVFYPYQGVSEIQRRQMVSQAGDNVAVIAVKGNFDDAQTGVKNVFNHEQYKEELAKAGFQLSSANSINWGRLVPQIVYYFSAYADLVREGQIALGHEVNFVVPTGNFGNILAGYYAKQMGLPVKRLICASNANNVLTDFLQTGVYDRKRGFHKTISPSMDILISSNLERLLYHITGGNTEQIKAWMTALNTEGRYDIGAENLTVVQELFWAGWADDAGTMRTIKDIYERYGYTADPHTAVAWQVGNTYRRETGDATPSIILSTASPYKFNESVLQAITGKDLAGKDEFDMLEELAGLSGLEVPPSLAGLKDAPARFGQTCEKTELEQVIKCLLVK